MDLEQIQTAVTLVAVVALVGLGIPTFLWMLRQVDPAKRILLSAVALVVVALLRELAQVVGVAGMEASALQITSFVLAVNLGLQIVILLVWDGLLRRGLGIDLPRILVDVLTFVGLSVAVFVAVGQVAGGTVDLSEILVTSTVISAVIGLALQDTLGNAFAGLALHLEGPFKVGDWVKIAGQEGKIVQMSWRSTTVRTRDNDLVTMPNGQVAQLEIVNYEEPSRIEALNVRIGVSYDDAPERVKKVLIAAASGVDGVAHEPAPYAFVEAFEDPAVRYRLKFWISDYSRAPELSSAVMTAAFYGLARHGMTIPFATQDVRIVTEGEPIDVAASRGQAKAALARVSVLAPLETDQLDALAAGATVEVYAAGEIIVRQGDPGDSLFVVFEGEVAVEVDSDDGSVELARRGAGDFFGEMSLLTGAPRSATVRAVTEVSVVSVGKAAISELVQADPRIADALADVLAEREAHTARVLEEQAGSRPPAAKADLLQRIRAFFDLTDEV